ncbi:MAG: hypothetical protein KF830_12710 [Planctomycetes bacterium]|nr:hypothetical protein [Planctomycetota bacterium]
MRFLSVLCTLPLLGTALSAQCLDTAGGTSAGLLPYTAFPIDDEGRSSPIDMLFGPGGFPMAGAAGPLTHAVVESNGVVYLTAGGPAIDPVDYGASGLSDLRGGAGASPRVFPFWTDLEGGPGWNVTVDTSVAGRFKVVWNAVQLYASSGPQFSCSAALYATGVIEFDYSPVPVAFGFAGASIGDSVGSGTETSVDLALGGNSGSLGLLFQAFDGFSVPTLSQARVRLVPTGTGGYASSGGPCAAHQAYGDGCYPVARETWYQYLPDAAQAKATLQSSIMTLLPGTTGYGLAGWYSGALGVPNSTAGATAFPRSDDGQHLLDLTVQGLPPLSVPGGGTVTKLYVHDNGIIAFGPTNLGGAWNAPHFNDYTPSPSFRNAPEQAIWSWHDWDPSDVTGGQIKWHYAALNNRLYITWDGVENYPGGVTNPGTMQFTFHLSTGQVDVFWYQIDDNTTSTWGSSHLVGYSPAGPSADPGSAVLAALAPYAPQPDLPGMSLAASPPPVIDPSTLVTFTASLLPPYDPLFPVYLSTLFLSVNPLPGGIDLGIIGAPGCSAYVATLDLDLGAQLTFAPWASWSFSVDNLAFAPGDVIAAQAVALVIPNSLPNGQNAFGMVTSNGVLSTMQPR